MVELTKENNSHRIIRRAKLKENISNPAEKRRTSSKDFEGIVIPKKYYPATRYGKIIITIKDGKIVNCETSTNFIN